MSLLFLTLATLSAFCKCSATTDYPEQNPELGVYQDASDGFPLTETSYVVYRNFKEDPEFGSSKCLRFTQVSPEHDGGYPTLAQWGQGNQSLNLLITLQSSEGYTVKNQFVYHPQFVFIGLYKYYILDVLNTSMAENKSLVTQVAFLDPGNCAVTRDLYVSEGACSLFARRSQIGKDTTCCDFVYDLLCGTTKYPIYDSSCK